MGYIRKGKIKSSEIIEFMEIKDDTSGSCLIFTGKVRADKVGKEKVREIIYESYAPMAEKECERIKNEAMERYKVKDILIRHRIGKVKVGEIAFLVGVISSHRREGLKALSYVIENVKKRAPIWKKEVLTDGKTRWRENDRYKRKNKNTPNSKGSSYSQNT